MGGSQAGAWDRAVGPGLRSAHPLRNHPQGAPYIGIAYTQTFGEAAKFTREEGGIAHDPRFIFGLRV
jgi:uncharacterized protein involved in copper resistance